MKEMIYKETWSKELLEYNTYKGYNYAVVSQGVIPCGYVEIPLFQTSLFMVMWFCLNLAITKITKGTHCRLIKLMPNKFATQSMIIKNSSRHYWTLYTAIMITISLSPKQRLSQCLRILSGSYLRN